MYVAGGLDIAPAEIEAVLTDGTRSPPAASSA
jgi:hypothetical protein